MSFRPNILVWICICLVVSAARLCHLDIVWIEEAYGSAAAAEVLSGKALYRDVWFDKPPLYALFYVFSGAKPGLPLRVVDILFTLLCAYSGYWAGVRLWSRNEGLLAAAFFCFFLTFGLPSAVIAVAPDLLMIPLHLLAILCVLQNRPAAAGLLCSLALLCNSKALFVLAACLALSPHQALRILVSFCAVQAAVAAGFVAIGAWAGYVEQVWSWGFRYSADTFVANPLGEGLRRTAAWAGFHASIVLAAAYCVWRERSWKFAVWIAISYAGVCAGLRFFPRYYLQLLPPMILAASRGFFLLSQRARVAVLLLMLVPAVRFGPRYVTLGTDLIAGRTHAWSDLALMNDSKQVAENLQSQKSPSSALLVWGYRPDVFVFSGMPAATRFLDSQPLTGVIADRHLIRSLATFPDLAAENRKELMGTRPTFIIDGLGRMNGSLAIGAYPELATWLSNHYSIIAETPLSVIYGLRPE